MKTSKILVFAILFVLLLGCAQNEIYFEYQTVPSTGWNKDSLLNFDVNMEDTISKYNVLIHVRHHGNYPYQNLWLFLENTGVKDSIAQKDTIEFYLADEYGKWLGKGVGGLKEMPVLYKQQILFPDSGMYNFKIGHGMRDSVLVGINDVGIRIEKIE